MTALTLAEDTRIDQLARDAYGSERGGNVEALLAANPGLAALGPLIPRGTVVLLPQRSEPGAASAFTVNPWD